MPQKRTTTLKEAPLQDPVKNKVLQVKYKVTVSINMSEAEKKTQRLAVASWIEEHERTVVYNLKTAMYSVDQN